jgi:hypothetical protein
MLVNLVSEEKVGKLSYPRYLRNQQIYEIHDMITAGISRYNRNGLCVKEMTTLTG